MKKTIIVLFAILGVLAAAVPADAAPSVIKQLGARTSISTTSGAATTGEWRPGGSCDVVRFGVYGKSTNNATIAQIYADVASDTTGTRYMRSASLGSVGGKNSFYMRDATTAANQPYFRFYLDYAAGFTGSVDEYCVRKGSQ